MTDLEGFDKFVEDNNIRADEMGEAFAAYLNGATGWDGEMERAPDLFEAMGLPELPPLPGAIR